MKKLIGTSLLTVVTTFSQCSPVYADTELVLMTKSMHIGDYSSKFNEDNYGVGIEDIERVSGLNLTIGGYVYHNSYYKPSLAIFVGKELVSGPVSYGIGIGLANGYKEDVNSVGDYLASPMATLGYQLTKDLAIGVKTSFPFGSLLSDGGYDVANLQLTFKL